MHQTASATFLCQLSLAICGQLTEALVPATVLQRSSRLSKASSSLWLSLNQLILRYSTLTNRGLADGYLGSHIRAQVVGAFRVGNDIIRP